MMTSFGCGWLCLVVLANDAYLAVGHRFVTTPGAHEAIQGYVWEDELFVFCQSFGFRARLPIDLRYPSDIWGR